MDGRVSLGEIEAAYRLILGRDPDPGGFDIYREHAARGMTLYDLRNSFLQSEEFRQSTGFVIPASVSAEGLTIVVDANEPEFGREIAKHGTWEPHLIEILRRSLSPGDVFVDVGANVGVMSFNAASIVGERGKVLAFEPLPDNIQNFSKGVVANGFRNVTLFPFALSAERSVFALEGSSNGYLMPADVEKRQALALKGDDILIDEARIDFVKIDIEGHEPFAIEGLAKTLKRHLPTVLCEFNPRCLVEHIGRDPHVFAEQIFALTDKVDAIDWDGTVYAAGDAAALMDIWREQNLRAVSSHRLPDGMAHLDLLYRVKS